MKGEGALRGASGLRPADRQRRGPVTERTARAAPCYSARLVAPPSRSLLLKVKGAVAPSFVLRPSRFVWLRPRLDPEAVHPCADLIPGGYFRVRGGERVEERAVAAAEVAHADGALGIGDDFEVAAGEVFVGH